MLKIQKFNIGIKQELKFSNIGDYWDEETMAKITDLLHEYQDLFSTKFSKMKGILGDLAEMKIPLKPCVRPVKQSPYRLNLGYKKRVKATIDRMLDAGIIEPVKES